MILNFQDQEINLPLWTATTKRYTGIVGETKSR